MPHTSYQLPQLLSPRQPFGPPIIPARLLWTSSSLGLWRSCKRKWFWKYIMRLIPRVKDKNLVIGSIFHECVAQWYRGRRSSMQSITANYTKQLQDYFAAKSGFYSQEDVDAFDVAINNFGGMMLAYAEQYDQDRRLWKIKRNLIEKQFLVACGDFDFGGKIDLVLDNKEQAVVEHKTTSKIRTGYVERLPLDTQIRAYMFGSRHGLNVKTQTVLYDVVAKSKWRRKSNESVEEFSLRNAKRYMAEPNKFFYREPIPVTKDALASFEFELHQTHGEYKQLIRSLKSDGLLDPRNWGSNDKICDQYFKQCEFLSLCLEGLDKGTARGFDQNKDMHEELDKDED